MDTKELGDAILGHDPKKRDEWHALMRDPVFVPIYNYKTWDETRDHPERKMRAISKANIVSVTDFGTNPHNIFAAHEFLGMTDGALAVKFTV
jgi:acyl-CoA oxidase